MCPTQRGQLGAGCIYQAAWTFTPVGRSADLTWLACSHHLLEFTSSGVHKASKAAAIFNVVFGLRVYYRLQREKFSFCDLIRRSCEVGVSICDWEVCIRGVWIQVRVRPGARLFQHSSGCEFLPHGETVDAATAIHPTSVCQLVPALLIYSTAVTQHHSVRSSRMKNQTAGSFCETLEEIWLGCKGARPDFYSCCQKFEPQTYRTSETLFYGDRRTTNVLQAAADCAFSAIQPLHLHPEWRVLLTATFKEQPASKYNYTQLYCIIMK